jgi:hypothetical protein
MLDSALTKVRRKSMQSVNLEGLTEDERELLAQFADLLRASRGKREAQTEFGRLLDKLASLPNTMTEQEAEALALEAVAFARGRQP